MLMNEFCTGYFLPKNEEQESLMNEYKRKRALFGEPSRIQILRQLVKTRPFTKSVYPPNWRIA
jgi:hypothetical protein